MRKSLILILIILLLVAMGFMVVQSVNIGGLQILGVTSLGQENKKLDSTIQTASRLSSTEYQRALTDLSASAKDYKTAKSEYDELVTISTNSEVAVARQLQKYEIEYLWTKIGTHATSEDVILKIEVSANSTSEATGYYDLKFTATGDYVGVTDFIYDIENDSSLGFKIENFKMLPVSQQVKEMADGKEVTKTEIKLQATFTCTNIAINIDPSEITTQNNGENQEGTNNNENGQNNTNTTNTSNTVNTNTTNTTNTTGY